MAQYLGEWESRTFHPSIATGSDLSGGGAVSGLHRHRVGDRTDHRCNPDPYRLLLSAESSCSDGEQETSCHSSGGGHSRLLPRTGGLDPTRSASSTATSSTSGFGIK